MEILKELLSKLDSEVALVDKQMSDDEFGLMLLTALKESDYYYYNVIRHDESDDSSEHFYLIRLGLSKFIGSALANRHSYRVPVVTFRSKEDLIIKTFERLARLGMVQHARRMCYGVIGGECELVKQNDTLYEFIVPKGLANYEYHEVIIASHYEKQFKSLFDTAMKQRNENISLEDEVRSLLAKNVFVFADFYIGYEAHPVLDNYFFSLTERNFFGSQAFDTFKHSVTFGGLQYQHYYICLCFIVSLSLKHERFCEALIEKHPEIRLRDILTISCDRNSFIESIHEVVNAFGEGIEDFSPIDSEGAKQLYKVFSIRRDNLPLLDHIEFPLLVEYSDSSVVRSIAGAQFQPGEFLLESLKYNFPTDYDRNQNNREGSMQNAIERLLNNFSTAITIRRNIVIKNNNQALTDIDFVAIDVDNGHAFLFQLKHQDFYATDMKKRLNRGRKLIEETELWLERIESWLNSSSAFEINSALQLPKTFRLSQVWLVAIAKNFAHFLSPLGIKPNFVYGTWMQFYDAITRIEALGQPRTLSNLFLVMRQYMTHKIATCQDYQGSDEYILENCTFKISSGSK